MHEHIEEQILEWIYEETVSEEDTQKVCVVPIHLLLVKLAITSGSASKSLTQSTEIAMKTFDRANLYRTFRQMYNKNLISFVDEKGLQLEIEDEVLATQDITRDEQLLQFVTLTPKGKALAENIASHE